MQGDSLQQTLAAMMLTGCVPPTSTLPTVLPFYGFLGLSFLPLQVWGRCGLSLRKLTAQLCAKTRSYGGLASCVESVSALPHIMTPKHCRSLSDLAMLTFLYAQVRFPRLNLTRDTVNNTLICFKVGAEQQ